MKRYIVISEDSSAEELAPVAKAVNDLLVIPVTARSKNKRADMLAYLLLLPLSGTKRGRQ